MDYESLKKLPTKSILDLFEESLSKVIIIANNITRNIKHKNVYT